MLLGAVLALVAAPAAAAYPQPSGLAGDYSTVCPPRPADSTSTDATLAQLVTIEQANADACVRREQLDAATVTRDHAHADAAGVVAAVDATTAAVNSKVAATTAAVQAQGPNAAATTAPGASDGSPAFVRVSSTDTSWAGLYEVVWFVAGLVLAAIAAPGIRRILRP